MGTPSRERVWQNYVPIQTCFRWDANGHTIRLDENDQTKSHGISVAHVQTVIRTTIWIPADHKIIATDQFSTVLTLCSSPCLSRAGSLYCDVSYYGSLYCVTWVTMDLCIVWRQLLWIFVLCDWRELLWIFVLCDVSYYGSLYCDVSYYLFCSTTLRCLSAWIMSKYIKPTTVAPLLVHTISIKVSHLSLIHISEPTRPP